jgi:hypothetical protein
LKTFPRNCHLSFQRWQSLQFPQSSSLSSSLYQKKKKRGESENEKSRTEINLKVFKFQLVPPKKKKGKKKEVMTFLYLVWLCSQIYRRKIKRFVLKLWHQLLSYQQWMISAFKCISSLKCMHWNLNWKQRCTEEAYICLMKSAKP